MNKKGTTHVWWIISLMVLALLVLIILGGKFYGPEGLFYGAKDAAEKLWNYTPNMSVGIKEMQASTPLLYEGAQQEAKVLQQVLKRMALPKNKNCFDYLPGGFAADLGPEEAKSAIFSFEESAGGTQVIIYSEKNVVYTSFNVPNIKPCVIAGPDNVAKNFFNFYIRRDNTYIMEDGKLFINDGGYKREVYYTTPVSKVEIYYNEQGKNGNVIRAPDLGGDMVNSAKNNLQSNGVLFKGRDGEMCFFPTNKIVNSDNDGINNDFFETDYTQSLRYKIDHNEISRCVE